MKIRIVLLLGILFFACSSALAAPQAYLESDSLNVGTLKEGKVYDFSFNLFNKGDVDLIINSIYAPCGCVKVVFPKEKTVIAPGGKLEVKYTYNSAGLDGEVNKFLYVYTNDPANLTLKITIQARVEISKQEVVVRFSSFNLLAVTGAGLIDGINPCAFTVLVFFITFLGFAGYSRKQIVVLGTFFILAVFITYILIGFGLFEFFRRLEIFYIFSKIIYVLTAVIALILGGFSLYDYWIFKKTGDTEKITLKLPPFVKRQIQKVIKDKTDLRGKAKLESVSKFKLAVAALSSGFIVSVLESICTGQMYLPTIVYVLGFTKLKLRALGYLLWYNLMFVLPLVGVFLLGLFGTTSEGFARLARRHMAKVKIITSAVFFGLGIGLLLIIKK